MSQRPILKIRAPSLAQNPPPDVPTSTTSTKTPKLKLKFSNAPQTANISSETHTPAKKPKVSRKPKTDKPARAPKPSSKKRALDDSALGEDDEVITKPLPTTSEPSSKRLKLTKPSSKKRTLDNSTLSEDDENSLATSEPSSKRLKLTAYKPLKNLPKNITVKFKGRAPVRPIGVGYDSGASDVEPDPALEEEFILRMAPGDDCDYLRQAITERRLGTKEEGSVDVRMTFLKHDGRRAVVSIQKRLYAACMVDLPCIIEGMKSWDKRAWYKTADICQMLLVLGRIENQEDAMTHPLPKEVDEKTWQYAHGLTPPMRWARKRRFRKRASHRTIEVVEDEVDRLLALDERCVESKYEIIDLDRDRSTHERSVWNEQGSTGAPGPEDYGEEDAEGEEDIDEHFEPVSADEAKQDGEEEDEDELDAELKLAMEMDDEDEERAATAAAPLHPLASDNDTTSGAPTPGAIKPSSGDEDSDDDDENDEDSDDDDEDAKERAQALKRQREEIADLEAVIRSQEQKIANQTNPILKQKIISGLQGFKRELQVKLAAIGEGDED
ncbi:MAG: hypothetical protein Q9167_007341 [Letrouitia subvulpina]